MARQRDPKRDQAFEIWKQHNGGITNRVLAEQLGVLEKTISAWKIRDKWNEVNGENDCSTTKKKRSTTKKEPAKKSRSPSDKQQKRSGNPQPENQFTKRNRSAEKHGLFSKFLPDETKEIMDAMADLSAADLIWQQIQIQFAALIRAQKIMWVNDQGEMIKELKKSKYDVVPDPDSKGFKQITTEEEFEFQFAWDRQATFLNAQSRAMGELRSLIKQFDELVHVHDERRLKLEQMRAAIDKSKAEIEKLNGNNDEGPIEIMISRKKRDE